jgi:hypothetical protein
MGVLFLSHTGDGFCFVFDKIQYIKSERRMNPARTSIRVTRRRERKRMQRLKTTNSKKEGKRKREIYSTKILL